jgi:hypothetical protein
MCAKMIADFLAVRKRSKVLRPAEFVIGETKKGQPPRGFGKGARWDGLPNRRRDANAIH